MRIWFKAFDDSNHLVNDIVVEDNSDSSEKSRTTKIFEAVTAACHKFDLSEPIWLESNIKEFKAHAKTRFYKDNFVDEIDFLFLEIHVIEED